MANVTDRRGPGIWQRLRIALKRRAYAGGGRDRWQHPERVMEALRVRPGMRIADLGAGPGYFTFRFASLVGASGRVYALETDADMRLALVERAERDGIAAVETVAAEPDRLVLPEPVDLVFLCNVFHHLANPVDLFRQAAAQLRPAGRIAILEAEPSAITRLWPHATDPTAIRAAMGRAGYRLASDHPIVQRQSLQVFAPDG